MSFEITITLPTGRFRLQVSQIYIDTEIERFKVTGGHRFFILQSNRPALRAVQSRKAIKWEVLEMPQISGSIESTTYALFRIIQEMEFALKEQEKNS